MNNGYLNSMATSGTHVAASNIPLHSSKENNVVAGSTASAANNRHHLLSTSSRHESREFDDQMIVQERCEEIAAAYLNIIEAVGEDPMRQGLVKTPQRAAEAILHFTKGYEENLEGILDHFVS